MMNRETYERKCAEIRARNARRRQDAIVGQAVRANKARTQRRAEITLAKIAAQKNEALLQAKITPKPFGKPQWFDVSLAEWVRLNNLPYKMIHNAYVIIDANTSKKYVLDWESSDKGIYRAKEYIG